MSCSRLVALVASLAVLPSGCGGRLEAPFGGGTADELPTPTADATIDGVDSPDDADPDAPAPPASYDGSPERCTGRGNYVYALLTTRSGDSERIFDALTWRIRLAEPDDISLVAWIDDHLEASFWFLSRGPSDPLRLATYDPAHTAPSTPGWPGLDINFLGTPGWVDARGRFQIHKLEWWTPDGSTKPRQLVRLLVTYEQWTEDFTVRGCLNFER